MITIFYSPKGGVGTTVTAASYALLLAHQHNGALLVDFCGDAPAAFGLVEPTAPGVHDWLDESSSRASEELLLMAQPCASNLRVVHRGARFVSGEPRWQKLAEALEAMPMPVVIDAGTQFVPEELSRISSMVMVVQPCYLTMRRAIREVRPQQIVIVRPAERVLTNNDLTNLLGVPTMAEIPENPAIARAVDAGLLPERVQELVFPYFASH